MSKPKLIAHRGNLMGAQPEKENTLAYIQDALLAGFDVEVDVRLVDGQLYLGHDEPQEKVELYYLENSRIWVHAKTAETYLYLREIGSSAHYFLHDEDDFAITSLGFLWTHPKCSNLTSKSVLVKFEYDQEFIPQLLQIHGICSDYVAEYSKVLA